MRSRSSAGTVILGFWIAILACFFTADAVFAARPPKPAPKASQASPPSPEVRRALQIAQAQNLLRQAKRAKMAGNASSAQRLWLQAHSLDPALKKPEWLDEQPKVIRIAEQVTPRRNMMAQVASMSYQAAKPLLDDWLRRFPDDMKVREYYLMRSREAQDRTQTMRHQSILHPESIRSSVPWWKYLAIIVFGVLLIRESFVFLAEWKERKNGEPQRHKDTKTS